MCWSALFTKPGSGLRLSSQGSQRRRSPCACPSLRRLFRKGERRRFVWFCVSGATCFPVSSWLEADADSGLTVSRRQRGVPVEAEVLLPPRAAPEPEADGSAPTGVAVRSHSLRLLLQGRGAQFTQPFH